MSEEHGKYETPYCTPEYVSKLVAQSYEEGIAEGKTLSEQLIIHMQPYEIATKVSVDTDSKMQTKPSAEVKITRHLEKTEEISECIKADLNRGVEECMTAINEILKKAGAKP